MSRRDRTFAMFALAIAATIAAGDARAAQDALDVAVDQATIIKLPENVATLVVGNPLIADVSVQAGGMLVVTGKGYGATNVVALDRSGSVLMDRSVQVQGPRGDVLIVYRGIQRETYSCQPNCEQRITLGDGANYFNSTILQTTARSGQAQSPLQQTR